MRPTQPLSWVPHIIRSRSVVSEVDMHGCTHKGGVLIEIKDSRHLSFLLLSGATIHIAEYTKHLFYSYSLCLFLKVGPQAQDPAIPFLGLKDLP